MARKKKTTRRLKKSRLLILLLVLVLALGGLGAGIYSLSGLLGRRGSPTGSQEKTAPVQTRSHSQEVQQILNQNALDTVSVSGFSDEELRECFVSTPLDDKLIERLNNMGYTSQISPAELRYVRVLYYDFDGKPTVGELMVNQAISTQVENVFYDLFLHHYPIGRMILPDAYGTNIAESFADNNTVGLCFGLGEDNSGSIHERGYAIDLNPLYNPLIRDNGSSLSVFPMEAQLNLDRSVNAPHYIYNGDYALKAFNSQGFVWMGNASQVHDYKHFEFGSIPAAAPAQEYSTTIGPQEPADQSPPNQESADQETAGSEAEILPQDSSEQKMIDQEPADQTE